MSTCSVKKGSCSTVFFKQLQYIGSNTFWFVVSSHLKKTSQIGSFPQVGVKIKNFSNHHLALFGLRFPHGTATLPVVPFFLPLCCTGHDFWVVLYSGSSKHMCIYILCIYIDHSPATSKQKSINQQKKQILQCDVDNKTQESNSLLQLFYSQIFHNSVFAG